MRSSLRGISLVALLLLSVLVAIGAAQFTSASPPGGRARKLSAAEINAAVTPPGGIKTTMAGGNTVDAAVREGQARADGYRHIDTSRLISKLRQEGLNTFVYGIWDSPTDWSDLINEFAPAAQRAGIRIWVYIVPPSECFTNPTPVLNGRCSQPFGEDYVRWGTEVATLSTRYSNVVALGIDDFAIGDNAKLFTPAYMQSIVDAIDAVNPHLGLYTTAYLGQALDDGFYETYGRYIDGVIYPYLGKANNTQDVSEVGANIDAIRAHTAPLGLGLMFLAYSGRFLDAVVAPTASYVAKVISAVRPYLADGRIMGINLYGLPLPGRPMVTAENRAAHGIGRLSLSVSHNTGTKVGDFAQAQQQVRVDPAAGRYIVSFSDYDEYSGDLNGSAGYHIKQILVDGQPVWSSDVTDPGGETWQRRTVDLTNVLRGKTSAVLAFRLYEANGVGDYPIDVSIDDVSGEGFTVANGGFEQSNGWQLSTNSTGVLPAIDLAPDHDPRNVLAAAKSALAGQSYAASSSVLSEVISTWQLGSYSSDRDAMYGDGRLRFSVPSNTPTPAGACASASQAVAVGRSVRYELSFWQFVRHAASRSAAGVHQMRVLIDGQPVWTADAMNQIQYLWVNGVILQGPIDVGQFVNSGSGTNKLDVSPFVRGKRQVTLTFQLCEQRSVSNLAMDVGFDNIQTIGLLVRNPGFENSNAWNLTTTSPELHADIKTAK